MDDLTFEKALAQLESIVEKMEKGKLNLEQSLELYSNGIKLTSFCKKEIDNAKLKIENLEAVNE